MQQPRVMSYRDVARHGRLCGRLDAARQSELCALRTIESPIWQGWSELTRRVWEYAYHTAQIAATTSA
jgi:hypothetical protein